MTSAGYDSDLWQAKLLKLGKRLDRIAKEPSHA